MPLYLTPTPDAQYPYPSSGRAGQAGGSGRSGLATTPLFAPFSLVSDLLRASASTCFSETLPRHIDLIACCDMLAAVSDRIDNTTGFNRGFSVPNNLSNSSEHTCSGDSPYGSLFRISPTGFGKDGIVMAASNVLPPLLRFATFEVERRATLSLDRGGDGIEGDTTNVVLVLQRHENHILALRLLHGSWQCTDEKSQVRALRSIGC